MVTMSQVVKSKNFLGASGSSNVSSFSGTAGLDGYLRRLFARFFLLRLLFLRLFLAAIFALLSSSASISKLLLEFWI
jgi:hypothetical protein